MSAAAAMALTGAVLLFCALVTSFAAEMSGSTRADRQYVCVAWTLFASGASCLIAASWMGVTS